MAIPRVREVMREVLITVKDDKPLTEVIKIMNEKNIGSIIVTDEEGRAIGVFTERDLLRLVASNVSLNALTVGDVMTRNVIVIEEDASLIKAVHIMAKHGIRHLPIVDEDGKVIGIVSIRDAAIALARLLVDMDIGKLGATEEEVSMIRDLINIDEGI
ncbi:CBS domain-containing protein [Vulcanisaeta distributa]|uniref:Putative signal transduction protein with CBS domains n=1 Tax=Vulcanisaeta distributa (strain DSM 14429 / JCM 11212 / NBRC 100878 / IC-017) TaxID=572478 RepID=E1QPA7_VULDI|nr:CBS domain-containing protein [Vulcanisaeta distributa]ADN50278.1 putative signal transduction protein with CBS domains [Vulcanisaeta distributa DSM 14429]